MKNFNLWKLLFTAIFAFAAAAFAGCVSDNEDDGLPYIEVTPPQLAFELSGEPAAGSTGKFVVKTNRPWQLVVDEKDDWVRPSATSGRGSAEVSFNIPRSEVARSANITFQVINPYGPYLTQTVTVTQGDVVPEEEVYYETFGTGTAPSIQAYTGWVKSGPGSETVTYAGSGCDIRNNLPSTGNYSAYDGSGGSNLMFGAGETDFIVQNITLPADINTYTLTFGASYYSAPDIEIYSNLTVSFSGDGETWTEPVPYVFDNFKAGMNWNLASFPFTLSQHSDQLYIKFHSNKPADGNYRIDDVKLVTSNGGQTITLGEVSPLIVSPTAITLGSAAGATAEITVRATADWTATPNGNGFSIDKTSGSAGTTVVVVTAEADNTESLVELGSVVFTGGGLEKTVTVSQEAAGSSQGELIYYTNIGTKGVSDKPFANEYDDWQAKGSGIANVTYSSQNVSVRSSGKANTGAYEGASGPNVLFFGTAPAYVSVDNIALTAEQTKLQLTFGASRSIKVGDNYDNEFDASKFTVSLSSNGTDWTPITYTDNGGDANDPYWVLATADFTLAKAVSSLYVKFEATESSVFRLDDIKLTTGNGGQSVDLGGSSTAPSIEVDPTSLEFAAAADNTGKTISVTVSNQGAYNLYAKSSDNTQFPTTLSGTTVTVKAAANTTDEAKSATITIYLATAEGMTPVAQKTVSVTQAAAGSGGGDIYYHTTLGNKNVADKPFADVYDDWQATGSGIANVTYSSQGVSVRTSGKANTGAYDGASGPNVLYFGNAPAYVSINNIAVPESQKNMQLTFGASRSLFISQGNFDNNFDASKFIVSLSSNGTDWTPITYTDNGGDANDPYWVFATANFTLTSGVSAMYVKFEATESGVFRLDDITLQSGTGGQSVDLGGSAATPSIEVDPTSLEFAAAADNTGKTISVTVSNQGAYNLYAKSSDNTQFPTTISGTTVTVKAAANTTDEAKSATITIYLATAEGMTPVAEKTVSVTQAAAGATTGNIFFETFGVPVKGQYWPYTDENAANIKGGTGFVEGTTTYDSYNTSARIANTYSSPNPPFSGEGHCWFPAGKTLETNYFEVDKLVMSGQKNLSIDFAVFGNNSPYTDGAIILSVSADGSNWQTLDFTISDVTVGGEAVKPDWKLAKVDFTLKNAVEYLYVRWASAEGNSRADDLRIYEGNGGPEIDLGSTTVPTLEVSPEAVTLGSAAGATADVTVTANVGWEASVTGSGFTIDKDNADGNAVVRVTASAANTSANVADLGTIVFTNGTQTKTVTVSQAASGTTPTEDIYFETFGTPVKDGNFWPYTDKNAANIKGGTGFVEGTTTYDSFSTSARIANSASSPNPPFSGEGHCWFPTNKPIADNYFEVDNLVLSGQKNLTIQFGVYGNDKAYADGAIVLEVSADGTNWKPLNFEVTDVMVGGVAVNPAWKLAKADFTLVNAVERISVKWSSSAGNARMDDLRMYEGTGGQSVDLNGGSPTPTLEVSPLSLTLGNTAGAEKTFEITTTAAWTATLSGSGFTVTPTSGTGNATVTVTASAANTDASQKNLGSVVVAISGASQSVSIAQAAGSVTPPPGDIVLDFAQGPGIASPAIPTSKVTGPVTATYTMAGYDFVINAPAVYYFLDGSQYGTPEPNKGLYISKQGAYLAFPAIAGKSLQKVVVSTPNSSGSSILIAINDANGVAAEGGTDQTIGSNETVTFNLENTLENTSYRIEVMNSKNFQINRLVLTYSDGGTTPTTPQITALTPSALTWEADDATAKSVTATVTNQNGAALSVNADAIAPFTASVDGNTISVTPPQAGSEDIVKTMSVSVAGGNSMNVTLTKHAPAQGGGDSRWVKVTSAPTDWSGEYLIVYEAESRIFKGSLPMTGSPYLDSANNYVEVTINNGEIANSADIEENKFVVEKMDGGYSIKTGKDGYYISGKEKENKIVMNNTPGVNTFEVVDDGIKITSNTSVLVYNTSSNQDRFRYYKSASWANFEMVTLYKYTE